MLIPGTTCRINPGRDIWLSLKFSVKTLNPYIFPYPTCVFSLSRVLFCPSLIFFSHHSLGPDVLFGRRDDGDAGSWGYSEFSRSTFRPAEEITYLMLRSCPVDRHQKLCSQVVENYY